MIFRDCFKSRDRNHEKGWAVAATLHDFEMSVEFAVPGVKTKPWLDLNLRDERFTYKPPLSHSVALEPRETPFYTQQAPQSYLFKNRTNAGRLLASTLTRHLNTSTRPTTVLALSRSALPIALEVARHLDAPLDVLGCCELVAEQTQRVVAIVMQGGTLVHAPKDTVTDETIQRKALAQVETMLARFSRPLASGSSFKGLDRCVTGRTVVLVDDVPLFPLAWSSLRQEQYAPEAVVLRQIAACTTVKRWGARHIVLAFPATTAACMQALMQGASADVSSPDQIQTMYVVHPINGWNRGCCWYSRKEVEEEITDDQVVDLLQQAQDFSYVVTYEASEATL